MHSLKRIQTDWIDDEEKYFFWVFLDPSDSWATLDPA